MPSRTSIPDHRLTLRNKTRQCAGKSCSTTRRRSCRPPAQTQMMAVLHRTARRAAFSLFVQSWPCSLDHLGIHLRTVQSPIATLAAWFTAIRHTELVHQWRACDLACCSPRSGKLEPMLAHCEIVELRHAHRRLFNGESYADQSQRNERMMRFDLCAVLAISLIMLKNRSEVS